MAVDPITDPLCEKKSRVTVAAAPETLLNVNVVWYPPPSTKCGKTRDAAIEGPGWDEGPEPGVAFRLPHVNMAEDVFRGAGVPTAKSEKLLLVSVQPFPARISAAVFVSGGAGEPSEQLVDP